MRDRRGLSLIELIVVVAMIAVIAALVIPQYVGARQRTADARVVALLDSIRGALGAYEALNGDFSGLPCADNEAGWEPLRTALSRFVTLPPWSEISPMVISMGTCIGRNSLAGKGQVVYMKPAGGTNQFEYAAAVDGVYRCAWSGNLSSCQRIQ
jgi:prepilin-type N-terminal cleavage/methylation domain-containing protein